MQMLRWFLSLMQGWEQIWPLHWWRNKQTTIISVVMMRNRHAQCHDAQMHTLISLGRIFWNWKDLEMKKECYRLGTAQGVRQTSLGVWMCVPILLLSCLALVSRLGSGKVALILFYIFTLRNSCETERISFVSFLKHRIIHFFPSRNILFWAWI